MHKLNSYAAAPLRGNKDKLDYYIWDVLYDVDKRLIYPVDDHTKEYRFLIYKSSIC